MSEFHLGQYPHPSVLVVYSDRDEIDTDPDYQRTSGIWNREKQQLLIDSLLNSFDVPKLYFHAFTPPKKRGARTYRYAIIDGKQRLQAIWCFISGDLPLDTDFTYLRNPGVDAKGLTYNELAERYPAIKAKFDATPLDIVTIHTDDIELIEDMFSRLNEAAPLNAPEKRNAFGGPLPPVITTVAQHAFFTDRVPFVDRRYRHRDLAAKFLYLEYSDGIVNTKKADLDDFVRSFKKRRHGRSAEASAEDVRSLKQNTESTLGLMNKAFTRRDMLLRQVGMTTLYYHLFRFVGLKKMDPVTRRMLNDFERRRLDNRRRAESAKGPVGNVDAQLLEFDKHSQTPNDAYALKIRITILLEFLATRFAIRHAVSI